MPPRLAQDLAYVFPPVSQRGGGDAEREHAESEGRQGSANPALGGMLETYLHRGVA